MQSLPHWQQSGPSIQRAINTYPHVGISSRHCLARLSVFVRQLHLDLYKIFAACFVALSLAFSVLAFSRRCLPPPPPPPPPPHNTAITQWGKADDKEKEESMSWICIRKAVAISLLLQEPILPSHRTRHVAKTCLTSAPTSAGSLTGPRVRIETRNAKGEFRQIQTLMLLLDHTLNFASRSKTSSYPDGVEGDSCDGATECVSP